LLLFLFLFCDRRCNNRARNACPAVVPSSNHNNVSALLSRREVFVSCYALSCLVLHLAWCGCTKPGGPAAQADFFYYCTTNLPLPILLILLLHHCTFSTVAPPIFFFQLLFSLQHTFFCFCLWPVSEADFFLNNTPSLFVGQLFYSRGDRKA
jgi:hypothetical protein